MRIVFVTEYYTEGMGYIENGLTKALASLGQEVHVVTSDLNVYGNLPEYKTTFRHFLGPAECACGVFSVDGYAVHRLPHQLVGKYVRIRGLVRTVAGLSPDIIQALAPYYRAADIGVWPVQESISMLDAAACGLPLVVPERMGDRECVKGSGIVYRQGSIEDLAGALARLESAEARRELGDIGAARMRETCDWSRLAEKRLRDYSFVNRRE